MPFAAADVNDEIDHSEARKTCHYFHSRLSLKQGVGLKSI
jgi:hypothetical protein